MRRDASLSATERFALHKAKRAAVDARLAADKEKETNGPCGAADRDSAARQRLQSCWENRYSTAHQVQSAGVGVGAGARVGAAGLPSSCDDVASRDAVGAHRDIDAGVHGEGEVAGHIRHATYASSRDAVGARRETGSVSERDADAGVQAGGRVTGGVGHGHGRVADGAARASGSVCTGRDTQTDTSKGTSKDTSQDTYKDTSQDTYKDTYKDTAKDTSQDTSEEADKDTDKDTYTDPCTPHRGSHASAAAPAQHGESTPVNGNDARRARGASNSPPPTPPTPSAQQHALGVQLHVTTLGCGPSRPLLHHMALTIEQVFVHPPTHARTHPSTSPITYPPIHPPHPPPTHPPTPLPSPTRQHT